MSQIPHLDEIIADATQRLLDANRMKELQPNQPEPTRGSVVILTSTTGTVAQRFYDDGLWHVVTGEVCDFDDLFFRRDRRRRDVFLLMLAPEEEGR